MGEHIWLVRNPEGRVIGASVTPAGAVRDVKSHCGATTGAAMTELSQVVYADRNANSFKWAGYTLTREPLPTGAAGVGYLDSVLVAIVCDVRGGMSTTAILDKYRAALAASTRTGDA